MGGGKKRSGAVESTTMEDVTVHPTSYEPLQLVKRVLEDFLLNFATELIVLYVSDTAGRCLFSDEAGLAAIGFKTHKTKRMPAVILYYPAKNWLFLIDTIMGKGPITMRRRTELVRLFASSTAELIFCSAFPNRESYLPHCSRIAWNTDVWLTDSPTNMIHYQ
jgi:hypothetical protein